MPKITILKGKKPQPKQEKAKEPEPKKEGSVSERAYRSGQGVYAEWIDRKEISLASEGELITCNACGRAFSSEEEFKEHVRKDHLGR